MNLLLDTHVVIWSQDDPGKLGHQSRELLTDPVNELYISAVTAMEIAQMIHKGRLKLDRDTDEWLDEAISNLQAKELETSRIASVAAYQLPGNFHDDPDDRILVATAKIEKLAFLTADRRILAYPHLESIDARA